MNASYPPRVWITEVGPRDGLQNEEQAIPTEVKVAFVKALVEAGHKDIEVTSFVRSDRIPQLADAAQVMAGLRPFPGGVIYGALVPNERGLERALEAGVEKVSLFTAASETFNQRNVNASIEESVRRFEPVARQALAAGRHLRGYVSCGIACPYEGWVEPGAVTDVANRLFDLGCQEVSVGDTIGAGTPADVGRLLDHLLADVDRDHVVLHFHDSRGMAVANVVEGLRHGVAAYDASSGGLGGCPYAPGAAGNLPTEDLVYLLEGLGIQHGIDLEAQRRASKIIADHLGRALPAHVLNAPPLGRRAEGFQDDGA